MVTVHRAMGYRFVIFTDDHSPPHVHVFGHGGEAKIDLLPNGHIELVWASAISRADLRKLLAEATGHHTSLLTAWRRIHG
jgi:hypothetical protein